MLIPAITRKEEIIRNFKKCYYTNDMMYETGGLGNWLPNIQEEPQEGRYQYAIVDSRNRLIGYLDYYIDWYCLCAHKFGLISFDKGNPIIGKDLFNELNKLINDYKLHRIEWRMIGGNPVERSYDRFCKRFNGTKHILKDVVKDVYGKYHDNIIYEIIIGDKVSDNCKWEYNHTYEFAESDCGVIGTGEIHFEGFNFCPYCGKKIKIV